MKEAITQQYIERFLYLCLGLVFVASAMGGYYISKLTVDARKQIVVNCNSANELRAAERGLWEYILTLPPSRVLTPEEKANQDKMVKEFRTVLNEKFAQKKCDNL